MACYFTTVTTQGVMRALELAPYALYSQGFVVQTTLSLVAGSFMIHHCANTITAAGVGNGSTLVICMGIITGAALVQIMMPVSEHEQMHDDAWEQL
jgi:preprotein translocase subunit SecY